MLSVPLFLPGTTNVLIIYTIWKVCVAAWKAVRFKVRFIGVLRGQSVPSGRAKTPALETGETDALDGVSRLQVQGIQQITKAMKC